MSVALPEQDRSRPPRIVVGVDGSECSKHALQWAARLAPALGAELEAVTAWHFPPTFGMAYVPPTFSTGDDAEKMLSELVDEVFAGNRPANLWLAVHEGGAAHVLLKESEHATMVVVGSRGHGGFAGLLLGSVSAAVAEHARCPVLVVHGSPAGPGTAAAGGSSGAEHGAPADPGDAQ